MSSRADQINQLYRSVLGRDADAGGLNNYVRSGLSLDQVRASLESSPEKRSQQAAASRPAASSPAPQPAADPRAQQIRDLYRSVLGREADAGGLDTYVRSGLSIEQVRSSLENSEERRGQLAARPSQAAARPTPGSTNRLTPFLNSETLGLGQAGLDRARAAGLNDSDILQLLPGSGIQSVGYRAANALGLDQGTSGLTGSQIYERAFQVSLNNLQRQSQQQLEAVKGRTQQLESELGSAQAAREEARLRADAFEQQRNQERELSADAQLRNLRAGSTVSGAPGAGLGSLTSGRAVTSSRSASARGDVLESYLRRLDPTDSVLDRKGPVVETMASGSGGGSAVRAEASRRALAGGGASYYASRFG